MTISPVRELHRSRELTCNVCSKSKAKGVAAMPGVAGSFAYCKGCLEANAHPYPMIVINTALLGQYPDAGTDVLASTADWWIDMVECTLTHLEISREKFDADVAIERALIEKEMAG